ncbi:Uu.00g038130.m01.CDS01 [Anthostomella pinea]|uniref:Uu.00g038130.m01.CDS01 n=1 Tax=Anthostomella pinea TaxID=933095 RepID=A0AAI8V9R7_9PEZI|nr:Uu.00g038130.m01.CDS01 [Anthostomella pinea]
MKLFAGHCTLLLAAILGFQQPVTGNTIRQPTSHTLDKYSSTPVALQRRERSRRGDDKFENLGYGPGYGTVRPMGAYKETGQTRLAAYEKAVKDKTPDTTIYDDVDEGATGAKEHTSFMNIFKLEPDYFYIGEEKAIVSEHPELQVFKSSDTGVDLGSIKELKRIAIVSSTQGSSGDEGTAADYTGEYDTNTVVSGLYDTGGQVIIGEDAFKRNNRVPSGPKHVPLNEITWQSYASVAKADTKNLKVYFLTNVMNKGFWAITAQNYEEAGIPVDQVAVWEPKHGDAFLRLLGSDVINSKLVALANHHNAAGDREVAKVITMPKYVPGSQGQFAAALVLK